MNKQAIPETTVRTLSVESCSDSEELIASISSDAAIERPWGREILVHDGNAINDERMQSGLPLLINHNSDALIGRHYVQLEKNKLRGRVQFDPDDPLANAWRGKVRNGVARDFSIRYSIDEYDLIERDDADTPDIVITRWTPLESSIVSIPADPTVGIGRNHTATRGHQMKNDDASAAGTSSNTGDINVSNHSASFARGRAEGREAGAAAERERIRGINYLFGLCRESGPLYDSLREECITQGSSVEQTRAAIFELQNREPQEPITQVRPDQRAQPATSHADGMDKWVEGVTEAIELRTGTRKPDNARKLLAENPFAGMRLVEIGRSYLQQLGINAGAMPPSTVASESLKRSGVISHSSSDFTDVLANISNNNLGIGYNKAPETWRPFCRVMSASDYKQMQVSNMTAFSGLDRIYEGGEFTSGTIGDVAEPMTLRKYGKIFTISREAILNDNLDAFSMIPAKMGMAAARVVGDLVYIEILLGNPTLSQDSTDLFHADHSNYVAAGAGAAPSVTTLDTAFAAMGTQTDPDARQTLNITPAYLIVPKALEGTGRVLTSAMVQSTNPGVTNATTVLDADNRFSALTVIPEPRIDADDAAKWFLAADPAAMVVDTIAVAFLNGQDGPSMEQEQGFIQDGVNYKVRLEVTGAPIAYQGLYFNDGN